MTPERINAVIAEWCGWRFTQGDDGELHVWRPDGEHCCSDFVSWPMTCVPDYYHDLNAVHEAELPLYDPKQALESGSKPYTGWTLWLRQLRKVVCKNRKLTTDETISLMVGATAPQRCEALLRTLGKWEDA